MQEIDSTSTPDGDDMNEEEMFLREVINEDHQLLYLDTYLRETLSSE